MAAQAVYVRPRTTVAKRILIYLIVGFIVVSLSLRGIVDALAVALSEPGGSWALDLAGPGFVQWMMSLVTRFANLLPNLSLGVLPLLPGAALATTFFFVIAVSILRRRVAIPVFRPVLLSFIGGLLAVPFVVWFAWVLGIAASAAMWLIHLVLGWISGFYAWFLALMAVHPVLLWTVRGLGILVLLLVAIGICVIFLGDLNAKVIAGAIGVVAVLCIVAFLGSWFGWWATIGELLGWLLKGLWSILKLLIGVFLLVALAAAIFALPGAFVTESVKSAGGSGRSLRAAMNLAAAIGVSWSFLMSSIALGSSVSGSTSPGGRGDLLTAPAIAYSYIIPERFPLTSVLREHSVSSWDFVLIIIIGSIGSVAMFIRPPDARSLGWGESRVAPPGVLIAVVILATVMAVLQNLVLVVFLGLLLRILASIATQLQGGD